MTVDEALKRRAAADREVQAAQDRLTEARWALYRARMTARRENEGVEA